MNRSKGQVPIFVILTLLVIALFGIRTISSPEIWSHIATGQALATDNPLLTAEKDPFCFTTADQTWMSTTPIYDRLMFSMAEAPAALTLLHVVVAIGSFILLLKPAKKWGNSLSQAIALFLCGIMMMPLFNPTPIFFGMFFYAVTLFLLQPSIKKPLRWGLMIPVQILWTGMHPTFLLGPLICAIAVIQAAVNAKNKRQSNGLIKEFALLTGITLLITLINPAGLKLHIFLMRHAGELMIPAAQTFISPFSSQFNQPAMRQLLTITLFLGAGGLITLKKQLPVVITSLAILSAFFMIRSLNFTVLFVYLAFPFLVLSLQAIGEAIEHAVEPLMGSNIHLLKKSVQVVLSIFLIFAAGCTLSNSSYAQTGSASRFGLGLQTKAIPHALDKIITHRNFPKKILNLPYDGAYLSYKYPGKQFSCDQRGSLFPAEKLQSLLKALTGNAEEWEKIQGEYVPQALVLNCFSGESAQILRTFLIRRWNLCYFDGSYAVLLSPSKKYTQLVESLKKEKRGLKSLNTELAAYSQFNKKIPHLSNSPQLIGAGNTFLVLNRFKEALAIYSTLLNTTPAMRSAWIGYGQSLLGLKDFENGAKALEHAVAIMPKNAFALLNLQRAYKLSGNTEGATEVQQKLAKYLKPAE